MYSLVAIGGTFDRLHAGHQSFILQAFQYGERIIIGLTSDVFCKSKIKNSCEAGSRSARQIKSKIPIQNYEIRKKELEKFLQQEGLMGRAEIVKIDDVYGPAIGKNEIEALVVTSDTSTGGRLVNKKRRKLGLIPLKILHIPLMAAEDHRKIASTRIRLGEIDRWGRLYRSKINPSTSLRTRDQRSKISEQLRQELKKPLGILIRGKTDNLHGVVLELKKIVGVIRPTMIITVGDEVTKLCNEIDLTVHLSIFDFRVNRELKYTSMEDLGILKPLARGPLAKTVVTVRNPAGHVKRSLVQAISGSIKGYLIDGKMRLVRVMGEEDLAGVPAVLLSPLGTLVLYGQPGEGIVVVEVTEEKKKQLIQMMDL